VWDVVDLNAVAAFVAVADAGTFSGGADAIGIPKGSISRKISQLEDTLGVRLFHRTTRKVTLTDVGKSYYRRCRRGIDELGAATSVVGERVATPSGTLRISAPAAFGGDVFAGLISTYLTTYPRTRIELLLSDAFVDLIQERIDLAFRFGELKDSSLIARKLSSTRRIVCASPDFLKKHGVPGRPDALSEFDCIVHSAALAGQIWRLIAQNGAEATVAVRPRLAVQSITMVVNAAIAGLGLALVPEGAVQKELLSGRLVHVLREHATQNQGLFAIYPSSKQLSVNVRSFMELVDGTPFTAS